MMVEVRKHVLFDIDGTLADIDHRRHYLEGEQRDWEAFFGQMGKDTPVRQIVDLYRVIWGSQKYRCVLMTGRPERYRHITSDWLRQCGIEYDALLMRNDGDHRPDYVVKEEILTALEADGARVDFVVEDRSSVVAMWRNRGLICLQCADSRE